VDLLGLSPELVVVVKMPLQKMWYLVPWFDPRKLEVETKKKSEAKEEENADGNKSRPTGPFS
jgi:hypothetical protein